ncbi:MAG: CHAT domain-containing protein [Balneolaceae bacterium]|nr:MAG: CHAT domain-containing protein [Balneolaceae bacterium]
MRELYITGLLIISFISSVTITVQVEEEDPLFEAKELYYIQEFEQAIERFKDLEREFCDQPAPGAYCIYAKIYLGRIYTTLNRHRYAEEYFTGAQRAADLYRGADPNLFAQLNSYRTQLSLDRGNRLEAERWLARAESALRSADTSLASVFSYHLVAGNHQHYTGNYREAIDHFEQILNRASDMERSTQTISYLIQAQHNTGISYSQAGEINRALYHFELSRKLTEEFLTPESIALGFIYNGFGSLYYQKGDYNRAGSYFFMASSIFSKNSDFEQISAGILNNAAAAYLKTGNYERAGDLFDRALEIQTTIPEKNHPEIAVTYQNLALVEWLSGREREADRYYEASIRIRRDHYGPDHPMLIESYRQAGEFYAEIGDRNRPSELFEEALRITEHNFGKKHPHYWRIHMSAGRYHAEMGFFDRAGDHLYKARDQLMDNSGFSLVSEIDFLRVSYPVDLVAVAKSLGVYKMKRYDSEGSMHHLMESVFYFDLAIQAVDHLHLEYETEAARLHLQERNRDLYGRAVETAYTLYQATGETVWIDKMLEFSEKGRSRIALELMKETIIRQSAALPEELRKEERRITGLVRNLTREIESLEISGLHEDEEQIFEKKEALFNAKREWQIFSGRLRQHDPEFHSWRFESDPVSRPVLSTLLDVDELMISYISGHRDLFAVTVDHQGARAFKLGEMEAIAAHIKIIRKAIEADSPSDFISSSKWLYKRLLDPLPVNPEVSSLLILADQELHYLPFELLLTGSPAGTRFHEMPFLLRDYSVRYSPSASVLSLNKTNRKPETDHILLVSPFEQSMGSGAFLYGDDPYLSELLPLSLTGYETDTIADLFLKRRSLRDHLVPQQIKRFRNDQAAIGALLSEDLLKYGYIHLATHAFVNPDHPSYAGILLWGGEYDDGILYLADIYKLNLNASLVVLSACETGLGKVYPGEGMVGFTRAFLHAGASSLLVSSWKVNDQSAARLMTGFYRFMREGNSYAESLRMAKLELISHPLYASPRNWAAFQLHGI